MSYKKPEGWHSHGGYARKVHNHTEYAPLAHVHDFPVGARIFHQAGEPDPAVEGDIPEGSVWYDSDNGNKQHRYESGVWVEVLIGQASVAYAPFGGMLANVIPDPRFSSESWRDRRLAHPETEPQWSFVFDATQGQQVLHCEATDTGSANYVHLASDLPVTGNLILLAELLSKKSVPYPDTTIALFITEHSPDGSTMYFVPISGTSSDAGWLSYTATHELGPLTSTIDVKLGITTNAGETVDVALVGVTPSGYDFPDGAPRIEMRNDRLVAWYENPAVAAEARLVLDSTTGNGGGHSAALWAGNALISVNHRELGGPSIEVLGAPVYVEQPITLGLGVGSFEDWHTVGAAGEPAFENGFTANTAIEFIKTAAGDVHVIGRANIPGTWNFGDVVFTFPPDYRPSRGVPNIAVNCQGNNPGNVDVNTDGTVTLNNFSGAPGYVALTFSFSTL